MSLLDAPESPDRIEVPVFTLNFAIKVSVSLSKLANNPILEHLGLHVYHAQHVCAKPYIVAAEVYYSYLSHVMKMKRVHEKGFVDLIDFLYDVWRSPPQHRAASSPVLKFPVKLFRWGFLVFSAHQKRRYGVWCPRCGPYLRGIILDVCCGLRALRRTCEHEEAEVRVHRFCAQRLRAHQ